MAKLNERMMNERKTKDQLFIFATRKKVSFLVGGGSCECELYPPLVRFVAATAEPCRGRLPC